ncbi:MAG: ribose 5-phosphate isomerase B [Clostridia bacterium]|nr:ribose 5-phosphate isomerase B [Clostridia bacterium]MBQ4575169.1 ribose 5-phosphate isomerase B [Clostridia bacterium]
MLALACDHGGFELKNEMKALLDKKGVEYVDFGCDTAESVNYPDYAHKLCKAIQDGECYRGILFCGTGIGMCMAANKHHGIRAAVCSDTFSARLTRMHNDANVLCLGGRVVGVGLAWDIVESFVDTEFEGGRHSTRVDMVMAFEESENKEC